MQSTTKRIQEKVDQVGKKSQPLDEEVILVSQMQNMLKQRLLEATLLLLPLATSRRFILPRFGFVVRHGIQGGLIDLLGPTAYFYYFTRRDYQKYSKIIGVSENEKADKESLERRMRFINQFWSNSQYWH